MSLLDESWFTEVFHSHGTAFSLRIKRKLHEERSAFQTLTIYETETFGNLMVLDGCVMVASRDNFLYHEMMSHPAIFTHKDPEKVVIIGGGDCGTLREVLRHPGVKEVSQVEIDERVTRLSEKFFPELCEANHDPRAHFHFVDGIQWIRDIEPDSVDIIIVDSTDPVGSAKGLYAVDFYQNCMRALEKGGILVQQSESPLLHTANLIKQMHADMERAGFDDILTLPFPLPVYPSGWWSCTMAIKKGALGRFREEDAKRRPFKTHYYNEAIHQAAMAQPQFMLEALKR